VPLCAPQFYEASSLRSLILLLAAKFTALFVPLCASVPL
jgi:hypothetical protein